jgi:hypothetical protein
MLLMAAIALEITKDVRFRRFMYLGLEKLATIADDSGYNRAIARIILL